MIQASLPLLLKERGSYGSATFAVFGIDIHKIRSITVCVLIREAGRKEQKHLREFATHDVGNSKLRGLVREVWASPMWRWRVRDDLAPGLELLEGQFDLLLANAAHMRNVPGRKTDIKDQ